MIIPIIKYVLKKMAEVISLYLTLKVCKEWHFFNEMGKLQNEKNYHFMPDSNVEREKKYCWLPSFYL